MGAPPHVAAPGRSRLRREEHRRTKHDSSFSKWKILIGPTDWENHSLGKEGAERYRVHNLPNVSSPGVYEIGVAVFKGSDREVGKLDPDRIVVAYLGQAESVRSRLQGYGRGGAHLEKMKKKRNTYNAHGFPCSSSPYSIELVNGESSRLEGGLFVEIFTSGYPIVYRWAPMNSKSDAKRAESQLLATFDYPWNKVGNGSRRPSDVLLKIDQISSKPITTSTPKILKILKAFSQGRVGIPIRSIPNAPPDSPADTLHRDAGHCDNEACEKNQNLVARVLKFSRSNPRIVESASRDAGSICGVRLDDGSICMNQPVKGRKRCFEHKGKKKYPSKTRSESATEEVVCSLEPSNLIYLRGHSCDEQKKCSSKSASQSTSEEPTCTHVASNFIKLQGYSRHDEKKIALSDDNAKSSGTDCIDGGEKDFSPICDVILCDGSPCTLKPASGRKRCDEHKGRRIQQKSIMPIRLDYGEFDAMRLSSNNNASNSGADSVDDREKYFSPICGVTLCDGSPCTLKPVSGRKRCEEHRGRRIQQKSTVPVRSSYREVSCDIVGDNVSKRATVLG